MPHITLKNIDPVPDIAVCTASILGLTLIPIDTKDEFARALADKCNKALDEYLSIFAAPTLGNGDAIFIGKSKCLKCGEPLGGMLGHFVYALQHGEGACSMCGWPARANHYPKPPDGNELFVGGLKMILQYHPSHVRKVLTEQETSHASDTSNRA